MLLLPSINGLLIAYDTRGAFTYIYILHHFPSHPLNSAFHFILTLLRSFGNSALPLSASRGRTNQQLGSKCLESELLLDGASENVDARNWLRRGSLKCLSSWYDSPLLCTELSHPTTLQLDCEPFCEYFKVCSTFFYF